MSKTRTKKAKEKKCETIIFRERKKSARIQQPTKIGLS